MKHSLIVVLFSIALVLAGCVTPEATKRPADGVNLRQFQQLKLTVTNSVFTQYAIESKPQFEGLLRGTLQSLGYSLVDTNAQIILDVDVIELEPGSRGTRFWVGFGAGKAIMRYTARFKNPDGKLLAELKGGKAYSGSELNDNAVFKSDESIRLGMISKSVSQISEFIRNNGKE
ncbi:MAG TPA: DUF4410 domain-containing protein [Verrucomicrobiae bacterium]|nr:DUF4410 domain-containing protein [Verrucomicrobiae bacterium]